MKNVDIVFSAFLDSIIGPVQTLRRISRNKQFFLENGFCLNLFTLDCLYDLSSKQASSQATKQISKFQKIKHYFINELKQLAFYLSQHSLFYSAIRIQLLFMPSKKVLKYYMGQNRAADIIVFHSIYDCYVYLKYYKQAGTKVSLFIHADSATPSMLLIYFKKAKGTIVERKLNRIHEYVLSNVDIINSISRIGEQNFIKEYPFIKGKTNLIVNGIDDLSDDQQKELKRDVQTEKNSKYRLITVGSLNGRKGHDIIIEALLKLPDNLKEKLEVLFVGDGPKRKQYEELVEKESLGHIVKFVGSVPNNKVYKYLANADIYILMSYNEGLPLSMLEAIRGGLPVISTKVSGIPEIVEDKFNGLLINPNSDELLKIFQEIENYDWNSFGINSRARFEKLFTFARMRQDYLNMLFTLSSNKESTEGEK